MKKNITIVFCFIFMLLLTSCGIKGLENYSLASNNIIITNNTEETDLDNNQNTDIELINIIDLTEVNQLSTDTALEEFFIDEDYTYYFPSIKSEFIICQFSNGDTMKFIDALERKKASISDLDTYGIQYWLVDKNGIYINSLDKDANKTELQEMCDGVPLAPEGFSKP